MASQESYDAFFGDTIVTIDRETLPKTVRASLNRAIEESRPNIIAEYEKLRDETKKRFMQDADGPLDRHKCAACFMIAMMNKLEMTQIEQNPLTPRLTKERIVIGAGASILIAMIKENREKNSELITFLDKNKGVLAFPDTLCDEEPYAQNWALCLFYGKQDNSLHVLSLSNTLFLIEVFNRERATQQQYNPGATHNIVNFQPFN